MNEQFKVQIQLTGSSWLAGPSIRGGSSPFSQHYGLITFTSDEIQLTYKQWFTQREVDIPLANIDSYTKSFGGIYLNHHNPQTPKYVRLSFGSRLNPFKNSIFELNLFKFRSVSSVELALENHGIHLVKDELTLGPSKNRLVNIVIVVILLAILAFIIITLTLTSLSTPN